MRFVFALETTHVCTYAAFELHNMLCDNETGAHSTAAAAAAFSLTIRHPISPASVAMAAAATYNYSFWLLNLLACGKKDKRRSTRGRTGRKFRGFAYLEGDNRKMRAKISISRLRTRKWCRKPREAEARFLTHFLTITNFAVVSMHELRFVRRRLSSALLWSNCWRSLHTIDSLSPQLAVIPYYIFFFFIS